MKKKFSKDIFERYTAGNCTEEERAIMDGWYLNELKQNEGRPADDQMLLAKEEMWNNIKPKRNIIPLIRWASIAAVAVLAILFVYKFKNNTSPKPVVEQQMVKQQATEELKDEVLFASKVENSMVKLSDGSIVIMQKGSKLTILAAFNKKHTREVELEGKAFFDIAHNPSKPFIIYSGKVRTTVLGTAFDVTAIPGTKTVKINVIRGLVEVKNIKSSWITYLKKNMQAVVDQTTDKISRKVIDAEKELSWNHQDLEFKDISIGDAKSRLEDKFGYKISVQDPELRNATFNYSMRANESAESFIKSICAFIGASYTINHKNNTISIQPLNQ